MSLDPNMTIDFHSAEVNLSEQYCEARTLMGLNTTDLEGLQSAVSYIYVNIQDDEWADAYYRLIKEIERRLCMIMQMKLGVR